MTQAHLEQRFRSAPHAFLQLVGFRIAWPASGLPAALDPAATMLLDCFDETASLRELADDLVAALDLAPEVAEQSVHSVATTLLATGHLIPDGTTPSPASFLWYPPTASP